MRRILLPLIFGLLGTAVLASLGVWQLQRLAWKESVLSEIEAAIGADPVPLPDIPDPERDRYLPVWATGHMTGPTLRVLVSQKEKGAGYRLITPFESGDRRVLIDRGFLPVDRPVPETPTREVTVIGNLLWPDEVDGYTPEPDRDQGLWFARDLPALAAELGTEPLLIVLRDETFDDAGVSPLPVSSAGIPNDHLGYAVQWFGMALIWLVMTGILIYRNLRPRDDPREDPRKGTSAGAKKGETT
ncbi:SURF1 family protein [Maritimibacter alkaliphilus]|uniref:SURF1 family protein n=1 Tax=Maritimibacter alkaliphilus TaxID=404236 RepID=UPI001C97F720|nr:SURF1 family protein [Maritimibacter alkaliphilus]MBY6089059.1 SURF1 family protein [Maritimibacter alkaliphilus]